MNHKKKRSPFFWTKITYKMAASYYGAGKVQNELQLSYNANARKCPKTNRWGLIKGIGASLKGTLISQI